MIKRFGVLCLMACITGSVMAQSVVEHVVWEKTPIRVSLPLNEERLIRFPLAVSIVDSDLETSTGVMKAQDVIYLNAHEAFKNKRLVVQLMPEGEPIILSVSASAETTNTTPIEVVMGDNDSVPIQGSGNEAMQDTPPSEVSSAIQQTLTPATPTQLNPVSLTRLAIQSLYSPERLLTNLPNVTRTPMRTHRTVTLVYGASVLARPLISWFGDDLYVTAVELRNQLNKPVTLSPTTLMGDWQTAAFYPKNTLGARGKNDTTTVFLTSSKPFGEALFDNREFVR